MGINECLIAADTEIVVERHGEEQRSVGGGVFVGQALPVDEGGGLRPLVHDLAVVALALDEELDLAAGDVEAAIAVHGIEGPEGVAPEEPAEAGAGGGSLGAKTGGGG